MLISQPGIIDIIQNVIKPYEIVTGPAKTEHVGLLNKVIFCYSNRICDLV